MKNKLLIALFLSIVLSVHAVSARAQTPTSPGLTQPEAKGEVTGMLVNRSMGGNIPEDVSIMLHVLDQNYSQIGMYHTPSQPDGSFRFEEVPLNPGELVVGIVSYLGATYSSQPIPFDGKSNPNIELPIYETTTDLTLVQVDEMHVLFNFAQDGLEVSEIYLLSNLGDRTITGTLTLTDSQPATLEFPLPEKADYVFFKPEAPDRFVKLNKGFADKAPLVPGERSSNMMVSYLIPYTEVLSYSYTAPVTIQNIDYLLPAEQEVILDGPNLTGPEITTLQDKSVYRVYSYKGLPEGQTIEFRFLGKPNLEASSKDPSVTKPDIVDRNLAIEIGSGIIGLSLIGVGVWQWRKVRGEEYVDITEDGDELRLSQVETEIANLDNAQQRGDISEEEYHQQRAELLKQAKSLLKHLYR